MNKVTFFCCEKSKISSNLCCRWWNLTSHTIPSGSTIMWAAGGASESRNPGIEWSDWWPATLHPGAPQKPWPPTAEDPQQSPGGRERSPRWASDGSTQGHPCKESWKLMSFFCPDSMWLLMANVQTALMCLLRATWPAGCMRSAQMGLPVPWASTVIWTMEEDGRYSRGGEMARKTLTSVFAVVRNIGECCQRLSLANGCDHSVCAEPGWSTSMDLETCFHLRGNSGWAMNRSISWPRKVCSSTCYIFCTKNLHFTCKVGIFFGNGGHFGWSTQLWWTVWRLTSGFMVSHEFRLVLGSGGLLGWVGSR